MAFVVYNACYGGFALSEAAVRLGRFLSQDQAWAGATLRGETYPDGEVNDLGYDSYHITISRADPILVQVVQDLGEKAGGQHADLQTEFVPTGRLYRIDEYDGWEKVVLSGDDRWEVAE